MALVRAKQVSCVAVCRIHAAAWVYEYRNVFIAYGDRKFVLMKMPRGLMFFVRRVPVGEEPVFIFYNGKEENSKLIIRIKNVE